MPDLIATTNYWGGGGEGGEAEAPPAPPVVAPLKSVALIY